MNKFKIILLCCFTVFIVFLGNFVLADDFSKTNPLSVSDDLSKSTTLALNEKRNMDTTDRTAASVVDKGNTANSASDLTAKDDAASRSTETKVDK